MDKYPQLPRGPVGKSFEHRVNGEVKLGGRNMKYAIAICSGKQYKVEPGEIIQVDKLINEVGDKVILDEVLFIADGKKVTVGTPVIKGAQVKTTVTGQIKGPKILVFKYKPKVRYRRRQGHRQKYTLLQVDKIVKKSGEKNGS